MDSGLHLYADNECGQETRMDGGGALVIAVVGFVVALVDSPLPDPLDLVGAAIIVGGLSALGVIAFGESEGEACGCQTA